MAPGLAAAGFVIVLAVPRLGRRPFWLDEAFTVGATRDLVATWRGSGGTMALYYLLMWPVVQVSTERWWVRLPSLIFAALAVVVVHEIGRLLGGRRMGALAAGTLAATWALSRFALEARSYTLALLLVSLSWLGLVGTVRSASPADAAPAEAGAERRWWWVFVGATLLAPLAHGLAVLHFGGQVVALALAPQGRRWLRACIPVAVVLAAEGIVLFSLGAGDVADWIAPLNHGQIASLLHTLLGRDIRLWVIGGLALAATTIAVATAWRQRPRLSTEAWLALVPVLWAVAAPVLLVALSLVRPYAEPRYVIGALPGVALLVGGLLARIRPLGLAAVAWLVVAGLLLQDQPRTTPQGAEDWPALVSRVTAEGHDGDRLLTPAMLRAPFDYAWSEGSDDDADRPGLVPLSPTDDIGDVRRFYDAEPGGLRANLLADPRATVWYIDRDDSRHDEVEALMSAPSVLRRYRVTGTWTFTGELYLVRFEPRPGP